MVRQMCQSWLSWQQHSRSFGDPCAYGILNRRWHKLEQWESALIQREIPEEFILALWFCRGSDKAGFRHVTTG